MLADARMPAAPTPSATMGDPPPPPPPPPLLFRAASALTVAAAGLTSRAFLHACQHTTVDGLGPFVALLDARRAAPPARGLLTVSNHTSVLDDPLLWGVLPARHLVARAHMRHALGAADICFASAPARAFFALGRVLPTHRLHRSPRGGLFQPTLDALPALLAPPAAAWVHVFPEGRVHQHARREMRYFRWGVARMILEPPVAPVVVPIFIAGFDDVMHEDRGPPRCLPRVGKRVHISIGAPVPDQRWDDVRRRWRDLVAREGADSEAVRTGAEAAALRSETARRVRDEVERLRRKAGYPEETPGAGDPETYRNTGMDARDGKLEDGSLVKDT